jgi:hypothetical protein
MTGRVKVLDLAEQALAGAATTLIEYASRLSAAQESTRSALQNALHAGLRLNGDQVDPTSLLPPDPAKLVAAAALLLAAALYEDDPADDGSAEW